MEDTNLIKISGIESVHGVTLCSLKFLLMVSLMMMMMICIPLNNSGKIQNA